MQSNDLYVNAGYKLKTKEKQIEELNRDLIYWNAKMSASSCSSEVEEAHNMIKVIQLEFDKLNNNNTVFYSNFRNDDNLMQQTINKEIEKKNKIIDDSIMKGKRKELFMSCMRE